MGKCLHRTQLYVWIPSIELRIKSTSINQTYGFKPNLHIQNFFPTFDASTWIANGDSLINITFDNPISHITLPGALTREKHPLPPHCESFQCECQTVSVAICVNLRFIFSNWWVNSLRVILKKCTLVWTYWRIQSIVTVSIWLINWVNCWGNSKPPCSNTWIRH